MAATIPELIERAIKALDGLAATAAPVDDEQQYVRDLILVWSARLRAVGVAGAAGPAGVEIEGAIAWLAAESARIEDPHRGIDWLSTLPQAALAVLGAPEA